MNEKIVTNPIEVIWSGCKGSYGTTWQVVSLLLLIAACAIGYNLWNGIQGRQCVEDTAAIDITDANRSARFVGCGVRSLLEVVAGEENGADTTPDTTTPDVITVPE